MMAGIIMIQWVLICSINTKKNHGKVTIPKHNGDVKKGTLTVVPDDNKEITLHEGDTLPEVIGKYHYGKGDKDDKDTQPQ